MSIAPWTRHDKEALILHEEIATLTTDKGVEMRVKLHASRSMIEVVRSDGGGSSYRITLGALIDMLDEELKELEPCAKQQ